MPRKSLPERDPNLGLLDRVLERRAVPDAQLLILRLDTEAEDIIEGGPGSDVIVGWRAGIDAVMDELVPALKDIALLPTTLSGSEMQMHIAKIVGRIPLTRSDRGWK